ncbi:MAG: galactose-1-phosphate uridylyltransferase [candidate division Zixibacteria bacterium]
MPEFRQNVATRDWVIVSPERGNQLILPGRKHARPPSYDKDCPFCPGNEDQTPRDVYRNPENGNWQIRVIPNKFSPLTANSSSEDSTSRPLLEASESSGVAEVIIESPEHNKSIAFMGLEEVTSVFNVYRERYSEIACKGDINLVTIFHNHGQSAGTSIAHPHSQIVAVPVIPASMRHLMEESIRYYEKHGRCLHCDMIEREHKLKERMIVESDSFVVFCPFAANTPYETLIYPKRHMGAFVSINDDEIEELGWVFRTIMLKIHNSLDDPDYNYVIKSAPTGQETIGYFHWYVEITPRISGPTGFALGSGIGVNEVAPEEAARLLREIRADC